MTLRRARAEDAEDIAEVVARWTHIPVSRLMEGEVQKLIKMETRLHERVVGQDEAIQAVLADMAGAKPMDRLVCGDVGYGKTEVAMRAAMLAVLSKKQVAVLVPTTVLAAQHDDVLETAQALRLVVAAHDPVAQPLGQGPGDVPRQRRHQVDPQRAEPRGQHRHRHDQLQRRRVARAQRESERQHHQHRCHCAGDAGHGERRRGR